MVVVLASPQEAVGPREVAPDGASVAEASCRRRVRLILVVRQLDHYYGGGPGRGPWRCESETGQYDLAPDGPRGLCHDREGGACGPGGLLGGQTEVLIGHCGVCDGPRGLLDGLDRLPGDGCGFYCVPGGPGVPWTGFDSLLDGSDGQRCGPGGLPSGLRGLRSGPAGGRSGPESPESVHRGVRGPLPAFCRRLAADRSFAAANGSLADVRSFVLEAERAPREVRIGKRSGSVVVLYSWCPWFP